MSKRFLFLIIFFAALALFYFVYLPPLSRYRELKQDEERLVQQLEQFQTRIAELEEERDLLRNDVNYLEKVIRQELGLVAPGEIIYKFVPKQAPVNSVPTLEADK